MTDFSAFSSANYNVTEWIDEILRERNEEETMDSYLATLIMKLHVVSQEYSDQLEGGMMEAVALIPRTISEIHRMQEVLGVLDREMSDLSTQLSEFDQRNISGVEDLSRLDTLKLNMEMCRDTLEEHARWNQLVREAKTMMESGGHFSDSADRLETLQNSLEILHYMPGHEERLETCQQLTSGLMSVIQARVLHDITLDRERSIGHDLVHSLKEMLYVFQKLKKEEDFIQIYAQNRPKKLYSFVENCFQSSAYGSDVNSVILHTHKIPELYGQLNGFLFDESVTLLAIFPPETVPDLLCLLAQNSLKLLHEVGLTRYLSVDFLTIDEFAKKSSNLFQGASESSLLQTYSLLYEPFLQQPNLFVESESTQVQEELAKILSAIQFDLNAILADSLSLLDDDDGTSKSGQISSQVDLSTIDAEDISLLFGQYAQRVVSSIHETFQTFESQVSRGLLHYLSGMRAKAILLKYLSPLCSQQVKALVAKIEELRIASCLQTADSARLSGEDKFPTQSGNGSSLTALSVAKQLSTHDLSSSSARGKILLSCALTVLATAGMVCRLFSGLESLAADQLEAILTSLFQEPLTLRQAVTLCSSQTHSLSSSTTSPIGTALVSSVLKSEPETESELRAFLATAASTRRGSSNTVITQSVFSAASPWIQKYKLTAEKYFFDLLISAPEDYLRELHKESLWNLEEQEQETKTLESFDDDATRLPQQMLTQVGDHLLSLLQELESFASKNKLQDLLQLKGDAESLALSSWRSIQGILGIKEEEGCLSLGKRGSSRVAIAKAEQAMFGAAGAGVGLSHGYDESDETGFPGQQEDEIFLFVNEWLCAIADYSMGLLIVELLRIESFSAEGREQLRVDLEYLSNVINALDIKQHPLCLHLLCLLQQDPQQLLTQVEFIPTGTSSALAALQRYDKHMIRTLFARELQQN